MASRNQVWPLPPAVVAMKGVKNLSLNTLEVGDQGSEVPDLNVPYPLSD